MEGYGLDHFLADAAAENQQVDYRRIVGDTQPPRNIVSSREGEYFVRQTSHGHGHETAAQRYSATRIQAGLGPERWVNGISEQKSKQIIHLKLTFSRCGVSLDLTEQHIRIQGQKLLLAFAEIEKSQKKS